MKPILFFLFIIQILLSDDITALQQEKKFYKQHVSLVQKRQTHRTIFRYISVIFSEEVESREIPEKIGDFLWRGKCLTDTLCIYANRNRLPLKEIQTRIKRTDLQVEAVNGIQKEHFQRY